MKKELKIQIRYLFVCVVFICACGCVFKPSDTTNNQTIIEDEKPDVYKKGYYKDCRKYTQLGVSFENPDREGFIGMPQAVIEKEDFFYILLNNAVYKFSGDNYEKVFDSDMYISGLIGASDEYIFFLTENKEMEEYVNAYNSIWSYSISSGENKHYFNNVYFKKGRVVECGNHIFATDDETLYIYNSETDEEHIIERIYEKTEEEIDDLLPEGYKAKMIYSSYSGDPELDIYYTKDDKDERIGLAQNIINDLHADMRVLTLDRFGTGWNWYKNLYNYYTFCESDPSFELPQGIKGTVERCSTEYWVGDGIVYMNGDYVLSEGLTNPDNDNLVDLYEDKTNRIIGYNPDTNEVYLYIFENNTLSSKNLDSLEDKVIENLDEADTIKFYWCDSKLYWIYEDNHVERYGGSHEFK